MCLSFLCNCFMADVPFYDCINSVFILSPLASLASAVAGAGDTDCVGERPADSQPRLDARSGPHQYSSAQ